MLRVRVLGAAAGGGFPQWNCACPNCSAVRAGDPALDARTQDSLAVSSDGERWVLLNASPDVLRQVQQNRCLWPGGVRHSPIAAVVLTNGDLDHVLGLFNLRESQPFVVYATERVRDGLAQNPLLRTLFRFPGHVTFRPLMLDSEIALEDPGGRATGVSVEAFAAPGKLPVHLAEAFEPSAEDNVGLLVRGQGAPRVAYVTAARTATFFREKVRGSGALFFDGTFFTEDELIDQGLSRAHARDMAHVPISGDDGSLAAFSELGIGRRVYTHVNNTNPILRIDSAERRLVEAHGWTVATDGMKLSV